MSKKLPKTLWKVLLVSFFIGGILLQTTRSTAQIDPGAVATSSPSPTSTSTQYTIYLPVLIAGPQVKLSSAWTADSYGTPKTTFTPGETIRFYTTGINFTGNSALASFSWSQEGPCGSSTLSIETVNVNEDGWTRYKTSVVPDCTGIYTFTLNISYDGQISTSTAAYVVNNPSVVINSTRQAFDRCNIPSTSQMQKWWTSSPYFGVNLYIGGISRACANTALNEFYVNIISQQGWEMIPTWVGPQAPCSPYKNKMSSNATTAYIQGRGEASAAAAAATSLGFSKDRVIYYDLEGFAPATLACRSTVQSFLKGWTERLHELGVLSGVYGAAYSSYMNDWTAVSPPPDYVWIASWYRSYYDPNATVWGVNYLSDSLWSAHQRIRQYAGDHVETWGGVSFTIDSNVADGAVAKLPVTPSSLQDSDVPEYEVPEPVGQLAQLREMQQVSENLGWAIRGEQLFWTENGGLDWKEISPSVDENSKLLTAHFLNDHQGWLVLQEPSTGQVSVLSTDNRGGYWQPASLDQQGSEFYPLIHSAFVSFVDSHTGWVALKFETGSNFSLGSLFGTVDGGVTWSELTMPVGGPIYFRTPLLGWVAGGASGGELFVTRDGGNSWEDLGLSLRTDLEDGDQFFGLPTFIDEQNGYLPLTVADPESPRVELFASQDGGESWSHATSLHLEPENLPGNPVPLMFLGQGQVALASFEPSQTLSLEPGTPALLEVKELRIPGSILNMQSSGPSSGWIQVQSGECQGYKPKSGESVLAGQDSFICETSSRLLQTMDGGITWTDITP